MPMGWKVALLAALLAGAFCAALLLFAPRPESSTPTYAPLESLATPIPAPTDVLRPEFAADAQAFPTAPRYALELALDPATARATGRQQVTYTNTAAQPLTDLYLRLFPNTPGYGGAMTVTQVSLDGRAVTPQFELHGSALRVPLDPPLAPEQSLALSLSWTVVVPTTSVSGYAQFAVLDGVMALANVYPLVAVYDDEGWNVELAPEYGDAVYSEIGFYSAQVTAPADTTLVASGLCSERQPGEWQCAAAPMRDMYMVLSDRYRLANQLVDGVVVNSYYYPEDGEAGRAVLQFAASALAWFGERFGPYPYSEFDVVETPTEAGGIEYPGVVVIADSLYEQGGRLEWVVVHEVAHQWWYALVGNDQVDDPWLDEALAQYSTLLYYREMYGPETAANILNDQFLETQRMLVEGENDMPVGLPVGAYSEWQYSAVVYRKGPLYFHELGQRLGDEAFFDVLRSYYHRNRYGIATPDSLLSAIQDVSGDRQIDLFERWIQGTGVP